ncbi:LolA-like putative outer membrane lipoprotein chaperone [uncultured Bacteroides sp.]|uniref:LolA-like putative outer membrane lipoprotein chaperone n=1 Tax=uncultured Bacteroides sp. TaxID=162156 RepID=UPI0026182F4D|nr:LolA-like putative outer membrane lipoprotein chaperone [uncultured Bacteroides sp.]
MKRLYTTLTMLMLVLVTAFAQKDAKSILNRTAEAYKKTGGVCITFTGSQDGTLWLRNNCFYLKCIGVKSWFDGKTQWSYVEENDEVTISNPTDEELQSINPYAWISSYKQNFNCKLMGTKTVNGKKGYEIKLTPRKKGEVASIILMVSEQYEPMQITIVLSNGEKQFFDVTEYKVFKNVSFESFRFNPKKYPTAEIIDMR